MPFVENTNLAEELLLSHAEGKLTQECYNQLQHIVEQRVRLYLKKNIQRHKVQLEIVCMQKLESVWQKYNFQQSNPFAYFVSVTDNRIKKYFIDNNVHIINIEN